MRLVPAFAVFASLAGVIFINIPDGWARSGNGPWCAVVNIGFDSVVEICDFRTFEECRPHVLSGNRGFCNENPEFTAKPARHRAKGRVKAN